MIDITAEQVITFAEASHLLPTRPSLTSLWRWSRRGIQGHQLETVKVGGRRLTSVEALQRFFAAVTSSDALPEAIATQGQRRQAEIRQAEQMLKQEGV